MDHTHRTAVIFLVVLFGLAALIFFASLANGLTEPAFDKSILRLFAFLGLGAILGMAGALVTRVEEIEEPAPVRHKRRTSRH